jgi:hypothetical protein
MWEIEVRKKTLRMVVRSTRSVINGNLDQCPTSGRSEGWPEDFPFQAITVGEGDGMRLFFR